jgi:trehalose 6-phosphate synthase/phosphatase
MTIQDVIDTYKMSRRRLLLLDYDGTLSDLAPTPSEAVPAPELLHTLDALTRQSNTTVVIVSGRDKETLSDWLSHLPIAFAAEHGFWRKLAGQDWEAMLQDDMAWKATIRRLMQSAANENPGSLIEEKASGFVWHYRQVADQEAAASTARTLTADIRTLQDALGLRILDGSKNVEVQLQGINKGSAAAHWLQQDYDFILAAGDDATDEDLFSAMPVSAFTIKVGPGSTAARLRLDGPAAMRDFLKQLSN